MAIENMGRKHITPALIASIDGALNTLETSLLAITNNFSNEDRKKFGSIAEKNKQLANAIQDWNSTQPELRSPDVDWAEYEADFADRKFADTRMHRFETLLRMLSDFKIAHDYDNYHDAIIDYRHAQYKCLTHTPGYAEKVDYLKQFFPAAGKSKKKLSDVAVDAEHP